MKRGKRKLALLLTAMLTIGSFQIPVMAGQVSESEVITEAGATSEETAAEYSRATISEAEVAEAESSDAEAFEATISETEGSIAAIPETGVTSPDSSAVNDERFEKDLVDEVDPDFAIGFPDSEDEAEPGTPNENVLAHNTPDQGETTNDQADEIGIPADMASSLTDGTFDPADDPFSDIFSVITGDTDDASLNEISPAIAPDIPAIQNDYTDEAFHEVQPDISAFPDTAHKEAAAEASGKLEDYSLQSEISSEEESADNPSQNASEDDTVWRSVTFDANGGYFPEDVYSDGRWEEGSDQNHITYKTQYTDHKTVPEIIEHSDSSLHFIGWSYSRNGNIDFVAHSMESIKSGMQAVELDLLPSTSCTLYAVWSREILDTCRGISDGGDSVEIWIYADGLLRISGTGLYRAAKYKSGEDVLGSLYTIKKVIVENGITELYGSDFPYSSLTEISLPDTLTSIGESSFDGCSALKKITIPKKVNKIGSCAFRDCSGLTSIEIPSGVTTIKDWTFMNCSGLRTIKLPASLKSIEEMAFEGCSSLTTIDIPNHVTGIGEFAFSGCNSLTSVTIPTSVKSIDECAFSECTSLQTIRIPTSVTTIADAAFCECTSLQSIYIPASVTNIGEDALATCSKDLIIYGATGSAAETYANENHISFIDINKKDLKDAVISGLMNKTYTGKALTQSLTVKIGSALLKANTDYSISYKNNTNAGTASVTLTGKGRYCGTRTVTFKINKASIAKASVTCAGSATYKSWGVYPVPTVKLGAKTLLNQTDYTKTYTNHKKVGIAVITINGKGNYTGTVKKTFKVIPAGTTISRLTGGSKKITVTWKKQAAQTSGYQIQYSSRKDFKTQKIVTVNNAGKTSCTITGLAKKHKYYMRIRTYKSVNSTKYYSTWSAAKTVTTK